MMNLNNCYENGIVKFKATIHFKTYGIWFQDYRQNKIVAVENDEYVTLIEVSFMSIDNGKIISTQFSKWCFRV